MPSPARTLMSTSLGTNGSNPEPPAPAHASGWSRRTLVGALAGATAVLVLVGGVLYWRHGGADAPPIGPHQVRLTREWRGFYATYHAWTGFPLRAQERVDGKPCQRFTNFIVCRRPGERHGALAQDYELVELGTWVLPAGLTPQPHAPPAILQAWLDELARTGADWRFWLGLPIADVFCVTVAGGSDATASCVTYTRTQQLTWPKAAGSDYHTISLTPLGAQVPRP